MRTESFDCVVVGGGPAGSNTARLLKEYNPELDVALFEKGKEPAANCAGGLGLPFYTHMGIEPPEEVVDTHIREVVLAGPTEELSLEVEDVNLEDIDWVPDDYDYLGWVLDRQAWDNWQLEQAEEEGADVRRRHTVKELNQNGNVTLKVMDREENEEVKVKADNVALANGPNWDLAIQAGFDESDVQPERSHLHMGRQYHMKDPEYFENYGHDTVYVRFDRRYAPQGYVWSFPEGDEYTRWGNGVPLSSEESAPECLDRFLKDNDKYKYTETARENTNAIIPTANPLETAVNRNVALIGDTGHHCDPMHGGGMMFGSRAGKAFAQAVARDDMGLYDQIWKDDFLDTIQHRFVIRDMLYNMSNAEYDRFISSIKDFNVQGVNPDNEIPRMMWHCFKNDAGIFTKSAAKATKSMARQRLSGYLG